MVYVKKHWISDCVPANFEGHDLKSLGAIVLNSYNGSVYIFHPSNNSKRCVCLHFIVICKRHKTCANHLDWNG